MTRTLLLASTAMVLAAALPAIAEQSFNRIASFPVASNIPQNMDKKSESSSEIIAASDDGMMLVYSDSPLGGIGFVDISAPSQPRPAGFMPLEGEPTSVAVNGGKVIVAINTSESFTSPSGQLLVIDINDRSVGAACALGGQPDSVAVSPDGSLLAVAIENERDEDLNDGLIPQMPAGFVLTYRLNENGVDCASRTEADLRGLAAVAGDDPEPEFVSINSRNEVAVTLQENNHIVILNGMTGEVLSHFSAGSVDLANVDVEEEGALTFDGQLTAVPREPDAIKWLDDNRLVTANEGDYEGGSRGFTIFARSGEVLFESGLDFEYRVALAGHYPEGRSGNKGVEPEGMEVGTINGQQYIFLLSERGSVVGVYKDMGEGKAPEFSQLLPSGVAPEGAVFISSRGLLAVANEADLVEDGLARSHVTLYELQDGAPAYPMLVSRMDDEGRPIGFGALSGLAADPQKPGILYAVSDSVYGNQPSIFTIDANQTPAAIIDVVRVTRKGAPAQLLDIEGIVSDGKGGFWLASEGRSDRLVPHALYHVNGKGEIKASIPFPAELLAHEKRFGAEGITLIGDTLWVAIQREWADDAKGLVKLVSYNAETKAWGAVHYPLEAAGEGWVGLSEISLHGENVYIIERDNLIGEAARLKKLFSVPVAQLQGAPLGGELPVVSKSEVRDLIPELASTGGYIVDKVEGFAVDASGNAYMVTDNDGVDDSNGETLFINLGALGGM